MFKQYLKITDSKTAGQGVFTTIEIPADIPVAEATGQVLVEKDSVNPVDPYLLQIGPNIFLNISGTLRFINHSCDPNCRFHIMGNRAILYSLYVIPTNAELTFDYSTTSTDTLESWQMKCSCGSHKCRKTISGYQYLDATLQEEYKKKGMIPLFITTPIFQKV